MKSVDDRLRQEMVNGRARAGLLLLLAGTALELTGSRLGASIGGTQYSDDFYDAGGRPLGLGDGFLYEGNPYYLWNLAAAGSGVTWYLASSSGVAAVSCVAGEQALSQTRAGVCVAGGTVYVGYVDAAGALQLTTLDVGGLALGGSPTLVASLGATSAYAVQPISASEIYVCGLTGSVLWLQHFQLSGGVWSAGGKMPIWNGSLLWSQVSHLQAIGSVLTLTVAPGRAVSIIYDTAADTYSRPYPILGTPPDRRTWTWGLSQANGRYQLVVTTDVHGEADFYFALHTRVLSSPDGIFWRDEGPAIPQSASGIRNPTQLRGKLLAGASASYLISPMAFATGKLTTWLAASPSLEITASPLQVAGQHAGIRGTMELAALTRYQAGLAPGMRVKALLSDGQGLIQLFQGYLDNWQRQYEVGSDFVHLTARGPLGRCIGETAYRPPAVLDFPGRVSWYSRFIDDVSGVAVNGLATESGTWIATLDQRWGRLASPAGGCVFVPQPIKGQDFYARVRFTTASNFYLTFANSDETDKACLVTGHGWRVGLTGTRLTLGTISQGTYTELAFTASVPGYTVGIEAELVLWVRAGHLRVILVPTLNAAAASWSTLTYSFLAASRNDPWPEQYSLACYVPTLLLADGSYQARPVTIREAVLCDGGTAWTVGELVAYAGELAGCPVSNDQTTYSYAAYGGIDDLVKFPYVSLVDVWVNVSAPGTVFYLKVKASDSGTLDGSSITFQSGYVTVDGVDYPTRSTATGWIRVVWYGNLLTLYDDDDLLAVIPCQPRNTSGYLLATTSFRILDIYAPAEAAAWDYNQSADSILAMLLDRRRAYLIEHTDGTCRLQVEPEGADLISGSAPVGAATYYRRALQMQTRGADARGAVGIVGIIGANDTVYLLDEEAPAYGLSSVTNDNPWAWTPEDGLKEALLTVQDNRRARDTVSWGGIFDPALEIRDYFTLVDGTQWLVESYSWTWEMQEVATHQCEVQAVKRTAAVTGGIWGTSIWGDFRWR